MKEYLTSIGARRKWQERERNLKPGEVVLVIDSNTPRRHWKIGRIIQTYPGADGFVRVVDVKTTDCTYRREFSRISPLQFPS